MNAEIEVQQQLGTLSKGGRTYLSNHLETETSLKYAAEMSEQYDTMMPSS